MRQELRERVLKLYSARLTPELVSAEFKPKLLGELEEVLEQADRELDDFMQQRIDYSRIEELSYDKKEDEMFSRVTAVRIKNILSRAGINTHKDVAERYHNWIEHGHPENVDCFLGAIEGCGEHTTALLKQYFEAVGFKFDREYIRDAINP